MSDSDCDFDDDDDDCDDYHILFMYEQVVLRDMYEAQMVWWSSDDSSESEEEVNVIDDVETKD